MARKRNTAKKMDKNSSKAASLGDLLKRAREQKGLSIDDVHARTKIARELLVALEEDDLSPFRAPAYARAMAKTYARAVGLSEKELEPHLPSMEISLTPRTAKRLSLDEGLLPVLEPAAGAKEEGEERGVSSMLVIFLVVVFLSLLVSYIAAQEESKSSPASPSAQEITTYDVSG